MIQRNRRTSQEIEVETLDRLEEIICQRGFTGLRITEVISQLKIDHGVFLRNVGDLDEALYKLISRYNFWTSDIINLRDLAKLGERKFLIQVLQRFYIDLDNSKNLFKFYLNKTLAISCLIDLFFVSLWLPST